MLSRCLRVRSADASQAGRCCVRWQPALRLSAWTRSTSRISAAPSARVVSGEDLLPVQAFCSWWLLGKAPPQCQRCFSFVVFAQGHLSRSCEGKVARLRISLTQKKAARCTAVFAASCHIGFHIWRNEMRFSEITPKMSFNYFSLSDGGCSVCSKSIAAVCIFFAVRGCEFMIPLVSELWPRLRRNSAAQSRLSEVVSDDSRQHVLDYVPLFSWCDSNATWQCQQHCFLQQKEWWLAICISDLES